MRPNEEDIMERFQIYFGSLSPQSADELSTIIIIHPGIFTTIHTKMQYADFLFFDVSSNHPSKIETLCVGNAVPVTRNLVRGILSNKNADRQGSCSYKTPLIRFKDKKMGRV